MSSLYLHDNAQFHYIFIPFCSLSLIYFAYWWFPYFWDLNPCIFLLSFSTELYSFFYTVRFVFYLFSSFWFFSCLFSLPVPGWTSSVFSFSKCLFHLREIAGRTLISHQFWGEGKGRKKEDLSHPCFLSCCSFHFASFHQSWLSFTLPLYFDFWALSLW